MMPYIINVALIITGCLAFYKILLRKETFYKLNRFMLISCLFISFSLPLLPVPQQFSFRKQEQQNNLVIDQAPVKPITTPVTTGVPVINNNPSTGNKIEPASPASDFSFMKVWKWMVWLYWFGVIAFGFNFILQVIILLWKSRRSPVIIDGKFRIVEVSGDKAPCSFGNYIFINPEKYEWETYNQILQHEKVHIRQKHTLDILLAELVLVFQWFNPFAWIYRREMENNLEYLTDDQLTQKEDVESTSYQMSLLKVSAPHFPLSLTTNYNQSILKKRIAMMNAKRSNLHTAWKYFFLLPVLALFACLFNQPVANSQSNATTKHKDKDHRSNHIGNEGYWYALIKDDRVNIRFSEDEEDSFDDNHGNSFHGNTFKLSELSSVPKGTAGSFKITREAGTMEFTGKFENNTGMGRYKFIADQQYVSYMNGELKDKLEEDEPMAFFFIDIKKAYVQMLKAEGFTSLEKDELIPLAALKVDGAFIKSIRDNGFKDVSAENLVTLKALGIDEAYIKEIRSSGISKVDLDKLISFKAQGIDKEYITKMKNSGMTGNNKDGDDDGDDLVSFKAMNITEEFVNSFKAVGYSNMTHDELVSFKALGITPEYIKSWQNAGFAHIDPDQLTGMKSQNVTPEYMKSITDMGFKNVQPEDLVSFKALDITPAFIKSFESFNGFKSMDLDEFTSLKALGVTPEFIKSFEAVGFKNLSIDDVTSAKATGVTPAYITSMREKGFNYDKLHKYVTLKSID